LANKVDFKEIYLFVCCVIKEALVEAVLKNISVAKKTLARLFTPPHLYLFTGE
jgi:hypothetical protein